jgi:exonuclease SbcC
MIPLKIQLKNFLSYGPQLQAIDFAPYHLICLNGKNGHGKSALLDAITWAVWGQARKTSGTVKPDAQLLRLGQSHMLVIFEFQFNGQRYRIRREYAETAGKPYAALDFGIIDPATEKIHSLTDKTIRTTQEKIEAMLGLNFDSFVNTAFLRQGQSNEFSKKTPKERKDILASILNLHHYDQLRALALAKTKQAAADCALIDQLHQRSSAQLEQEPMLDQELALAEKKITELDRSSSSLTQELSRFDEIKQKLSSTQQQLHLTRFKHEQLSQEITKKTEEVSKLFTQWRLVARRQRAMPQSADLEQEYAACSQQLATLQEQAQKKISLQQEYLTLKEHLHRITQEKQQAAQTEIALQQRTIDHLAASCEYKKNNLITFTAQKKALEEKIEELRATHKLHDENYQKLKAALKNKELVTQQFEKRKDYYHRWNAQYQMIHTELAQYEHKKMMTEDSTNPSCPWCEQNLSAARKRFLRNKLDKNEHSSIHRAQRLKKILIQLKQLLLEQHEKLTQLQKIEQESAQLDLLKKTISNDRESLLTQKKILEKTSEAAHKELIELQQEIAKAETQLASTKNAQQNSLQEDAQYQRLMKELHDIEHTIKTITYTQTEHEKAAQALTMIQKKLAEVRQLMHEISLQKDRAQTVSTLCAMIKMNKKESQALNALLERYMQEKSKLEDELKPEAQVREQMAIAQQEKERIVHQTGQITQQLKTIALLKHEMQEQTQKKKELNAHIDEYQTIATAFGKEGVQALLIEDALPEIEYEANLLLAELTNNQAHIIIDSLRDLKKGGTKETLEIKISDPLGIRPYEMFSGGEAFRIDFALRIAISKLLARRAGTSLQTLIIDEGFGSQDEEGIAHISDALYKIQDHFAKIIIVSHLPSMKDNFPVHFLIEKGPHGSNITVHQQG